MGESIAIDFAIGANPSGPPGEQNADIGTLRLLDRPLAVMTLNGGLGEVTFPLPTQLPSGKAIPLRGLYLVCIENGQPVSPSKTGPPPFTFIPASLPVTGRADKRPGQQNAAGLLALAALGLAGLGLALLAEAGIFE